MKRRIFAALLTLVMTLSLLPMNALAITGDPPTDNSGFKVQIKQKLDNERKNPDSQSDYSTKEDDISVGTPNKIKVHLEDTDCNPLLLTSGSPKWLTFGNNTISPKDIADRMADYIPEGYYYTGAYFYDSGNPSKGDIEKGNIDYSNYKPNAVSSLTNHGTTAGNNDYGSFIGYMSELRQPNDWEDGTGDAAYNPTGVLHLVYAKIDDGDNDPVNNVWVKVSCDTLWWSHTSETYDIIDGSFELSTITDSGEKRTRTMTINLSKYVEQFNSTKRVNHTLKNPAENTAPIILKYDSSNKAWVPDEGEKVPVEVEVECEKPKVTITFDAMGGEWKTAPDGYTKGTCSEHSPTDNTAYKQVETGFQLNTLQIAEPTREGYAFNGWHQYPDCSDDPIDFSKVTTKCYNNVTFYAGWVENSQPSTEVHYYIYQYCYIDSNAKPSDNTAPIYSIENKVAFTTSAGTLIDDLITAGYRNSIDGANYITYYFDDTKTEVNKKALTKDQFVKEGDIIYLCYYAKTARYTIHHYLLNSTTQVADDETGTMRVGEFLTAQGTTSFYTAYKNAALVSADPQNATLKIGEDPENNVITLYYSLPAPKYTYTLNYLTNVTDSSVRNMPNPSFVTVTTTEKSYQFTVSDTVPMRDGYTFKGWNTAADGSGTPYTAGNQVALTAPSNTTATLYARWVKQANFDPADIDGDGSGKAAVIKDLTVNGSGFQGETFTVTLSDGDDGNTLTGSVAYAAADRGKKGFSDWTISQRAENENYVFNNDGTITFKKSGEYTFTVSEVVGTASSGMSYDTSSNSLVITVTERNAELVVTDVKTVTIGNTYDGTYTVELGQYIKKVYKSECGCAPETTFKFEATIVDKPAINSMSNETAVQSGVNSRTVNGEVTLKAGTEQTADMSVDLPKGQYSVVLKEVNDKAANVSYDETVYTFSISVLTGGGIELSGIYKNGEYYDFEKAAYRIVFTNSYKDSHYIPVNPTPSKPALNTDDHYAYIMGYPDGTVQPNGYITRAEASTIFFRLLMDATREEYWAVSNEYTDVKDGDWYNNAISTLSNAGIVSGYPDGTFRPNAPITRAEMSKIIALFAKLDKTNDRFTDIAGHWAEAYIRLAAGNGWIEGYPDGSFRPNQSITRAETVTMINRVLERVPSEEDHLLSERVMLTFPDCKSGQWFYIAIQEATNSHTYERAVTEKNGDEQWIALRDNRDWTKLEY